MAQIKNVNGDGNTYMNQNMILSIVSLATKEIKGVIDVHQPKRFTFKRLFNKNIGKGVRIKNTQNGIVPKTIIKEIKNTLEITKKIESDKLRKEQIPAEIEKLTAMMKVASSNLDFEKAIDLREQIQKLRKKLEKMNYSAKK